ncbi:sensor histidine kinase [Brumimicrobium aurantiacum]|uniref:histidine kinase n=1 Tax=Brumimicrobium aurantiacum TaxID=1737063 RepID=A0A3E1F292_9FLAO|nr:HAMP domain-containing sensor histidine kinase [Brumimicrobium aurantiacum]RFC55827.1 sensor histidine kinase [Brumimicrobium aurantiacum]
MKLYSNKQKWKIGLLFIAIILVGASLYVSSKIVNEVAKRERERVTQWADAIKKRAELVRLTNNSFEELRKKELNDMQLWIDATKEISKNTSLESQQSYDLPLKIINRNDDIPVIVLDQDDGVSTYINLSFTVEDIQNELPGNSKKEAEQIFTDSLVKLAYSWEKINPSFTIEVYEGLFMSYFYNDSRNILRLEEERDSLFQAFNTELIENTELVPVVLTDSLKKEVIASNLIEGDIDSLQLSKKLNELATENQPIKIRFADDEVRYVFYANSPELVQLQYFPYIQFLIIGLFIFIGYIIFSTFRKAEQNKVWAGMAKETAHQLGTPISSLMAWVQLLEGMDNTKDIALEMNKDVERLSQVTDRFSKIGATTQLKDMDIVHTTRHFLDYFKTRFPQKVELTFTTSDEEINIPHNAALFEWVIENICKNAIDAMEGKGKIDIDISRVNGQIIIDIKDNGKGMTVAQQRSVFEPGFTTKKRGWGLGLPLAKRIVHEYHKGRLKVLHSEIGKGTTFRIILSA